MNSVLLAVIRTVPSVDRTGKDVSFNTLRLDQMGRDVTTFCREHALCRSYFFVWKKRLRESAAGKFLEVQVAELAPSVPGDSGIEVRLQNGRSLVVGRGARIRCESFTGVAGSGGAGDMIGLPTKLT
jgi:hypothetical protein